MGCLECGRHTAKEHGDDYNVVMECRRRLLRYLRYFCSVRFALRRGTHGGITAARVGRAIADDKLIPSRLSVRSQATTLTLMTSRLVLFDAIMARVLSVETNETNTFSLD